MQIEEETEVLKYIMAEAKNEDEPALPSKRKPDPCSIDKIDELKKQKADTSDSTRLITDEKIDKDEAELGSDTDDEDDSELEDSEEEEESEDEDKGNEHSNGKSKADRKGKGILREDKGKGKLIDEDESGSDSTDDDAESVGNGFSDLSDDPLAEVDLDNILPSRTRRRVVQPGAYIASNLGKEDDDSDNSDA